MYDSAIGLESYTWPWALSLASYYMRTEGCSMARSMKRMRTRCALSAARTSHSETALSQRDRSTNPTQRGGSAARQATETCTRPHFVGQNHRPFTCIFGSARVCAIKRKRIKYDCLRCCITRPRKPNSIILREPAPECEYFSSITRRCFSMTKRRVCRKRDKSPSVFRPT